MKARLTIGIERFPEVLAAMRRELANGLRAVAEDEPEAVARRLRAVAAAFEAGQPPEGYE